GRGGEFPISPPPKKETYQNKSPPLSPSRRNRAHTRKDRSHASPLRKPPSTRRKTTSKSLSPLTRRASMKPDFDMSNGAIQEDWLRTLGIDHVDATRRRRPGPRKRNL